MNKEIENEINNWLSNLILIIAEVDYKIDFNEKIRFQNKQEVMRKMQHTLNNFAQKNQISEEKINHYLQSIYSRKQRKMQQKGYQNEYKEVIKILETIEDR